MKVAKALMLAGMLASGYQFASAQSSEPEAELNVLNFDDVELASLVAEVSSITGYTFIVHPDARTKRVTISSQRALNKSQLFEVFLSSLRVHGFAAVPAGRNTFRIVPEESAVGEAGFNAFSTNGMVTEVISLSFLDPTDASRMIKPVLDPQGQVVSNPASRTLVVVDYASNMSKVRELVARLDTDNAVSETIALRNLPASEMAGILSNLSNGSKDSAATPNLRIATSETGNAIIISGKAELVQRAKDISARLDSASASSFTQKVLTLRNAEAKDVAPILQQIATASEARFGRPQGAAPSTTVAVHEPTNSLILSAPAETLLNLERIVSDLDRRREQVMVEAIIVEMSDDTAKELGLQFLLSGTNGSTVPFVSTNFSRSAPNLLALAGALVNNTPLSGGAGNSGNPFAPAAINSLLGLNGLTIGGGGQDGDTLFGVVLNAIERDGKSKILSKPFNLTLDNGKSSLLVGQEVPIATGEVLGDGNANPFRTVERKKIGIGLEVTPKISDANTVRLDIRQEVSNIAGVVSGSSPDLIFNTREIETSVLAEDGEVIVIGGLIEQTENLANQKIPVLGDLPGAGRFFRSEGRDRGRTNLMVFIRPTIVRSPEAARELTENSFLFLEAEELWNTKPGPDPTFSKSARESLLSPRYIGR